MKQIDLQGNVYDIAIEANEFSDKALEQILQQKDNEIKIYKEFIESHLRYIERQKEKIERLNNIINEFEDWLNAKYEEMHDIWYVKVLNKLKELKGVDKE